MATVLDELNALYGRDISFDREKISSVTSTTQELQATFEEKFPYSVKRLITGDEYIFNILFVDKIRYAMSTDYLGFLDTMELDLWEAFVQFEDEFSHTADKVLYPNAIGCTVPNNEGVSFVVTNEGTTNGTCSIIASDLAQVDLARSLDTTLMKIINCQDYIPVVISEEELVNVSPTCSI